MYTVYSKNNCTYCHKAKQLLQQSGEQYEVLTLGADYDREWLIDHIHTNYNIIPRTMPVILCDGEYVGGSVVFGACCNAGVHASSVGYAS